MAYVHEIRYTTENQFWPNRQQRMNGIVIHSIGTPQESADVLFRNFNRPTKSASVHALIEPGRVIETFPTRIAPNLAQRCGHVGRGRYGSWNDSRLGFEMMEPRTIRYTRGAQFDDLNPEHTRDFFMRTTATAAEYCADICLFHGWSVNMIETHRNAHAQGWGSNHGDPCHLWRHLGYSIQQFRKDVQAAMDARTGKGDFLATMTEQRFNEILAAGFEKLTGDIRDIIREEIRRDNPIFRTVPDMPRWYQEAIQKAIDNGYLSGNGQMENGHRVVNLTDSMARVMTIMARTGAFDAKCDGEAIVLDEHGCFCAPVKPATVTPPASSQKIIGVVTPKE